MKLEATGGAKMKSLLTRSRLLTSTDRGCSVTQQEGGPVVRHLNLGTRLGDHLSDPNSEEEHGHEGSYATGTSAERLDEVNAPDDLFVLFLG